jgi:hypothetical protein
MPIVNQEMQRCPNCGAYVMSSDDFCPRCDHRLDRPSPDTAEPTHAADSGETGDPITDADLPEAEVTDPAAEIDRVVDEADSEIAEPEAEDTSNAVSDAVSPDSPDAESDDHSFQEDADQVAESADAAANVVTDAIDMSEASEIAEDEHPGRDEPAPDETEQPSTRIPRVAPVFADAGEASKEAPEEALPPELAESRDSSAGEDQVAAVSAEADTQADIAVDGEPDAADMARELDAESADDLMGMTHPAIRLQAERYIIPPAPYTPPPPAPPIPAYAAPPTPAPMPAVTFLQQRVEEYRHGGYRLRSHRPDEAILTYGKGLGAGGWLLAILSVIGALWYLLLLVLSGFQRDRVYIVLESDGYIYEDGPGAAHVRRHRSRVGRRWAAFGLVILFVCVLMAVVLGIVAGIVLTQERYQAALREAYPAVTLFEEQFSAAEATPDDVQLAKDGAVAFSILGGIALVGVWGGATLFVIGSIHAGAYQVRVKPLPGWD